MSTSWLPPLVPLDKFNGDWESYIEHIYGLFCRDFKTKGLTFRGATLGLKRHPQLLGKEATFWHLTSEGRVEKERLPDLRRCERICWPRAMIDAANSYSNEVLVWRNDRQTKRGLENNIVLALTDFSYQVILRDRQSYILLWTAYLVKNPRKSEKEYQAYLQTQSIAGAAP